MRLLRTRFCNAIGVLAATQARSPHDFVDIDFDWIKGALGDCSYCGHSFIYHLPIVGCTKCSCDEWHRPVEVL